jgi:hypothetical protein
MHRTQLYFDEILFNQIKQTASSMNMTVSAYIREVMRKELEAQQQKTQPVDFSEFSGMWENQNITQESLRNKAWK